MFVVPQGVGSQSGRQITTAEAELESTLVGAEGPTPLRRLGCADNLPCFSYSSSAPDTSTA
jgi:hypothetical protein